MKINFIINGNYKPFEMNVVPRVGETISFSQQEGVAFVTQRFTVQDVQYAFSAKDPNGSIIITLN